MNNKLKKTVKSAFYSAQKTAFFCAALHLCPAFAAQNLYFNYNTSISDPARELAVAGNWYADAGRTEPFAGTLGADCNGIVNSSGAINTATNANLELNSLTYIISDAGATATSDYMPVVRGGNIHLLENFNFEISTSESAESNIYNTIRLGNNRNITVGGDLNISYDQKGKCFDVFRILCDGSNTAASVNINGNVNIEGTALGGSSGKIRWEAVFGETSMSVSFSAIPEPSEIAAVLGAISLALAVRRRKGN